MGNKSLVLTALALALLGPFANGAPSKVVIGTTAGDFAELVKSGLKPQLEKKGYKVSLIEFTDYVTPNLALAQGDIDLNIFQHKPYLENFVKTKNLRLSAIAQVPTAPLGLYGGLSKQLTRMKNGARVALPNDPTNLARALALLADLKWIDLKPNVDPQAAELKDIEKNPNSLNLVPLEAAQIPRALADVDFAVINGNYATASGISVERALAREKSDLYVNWAVVAEKNEAAPFARHVKEILNSEEFKKFAREKFKGYNFPVSWN